MPKVTENRHSVSISFYFLPHGHHTHLKSNKMRERLNEQSKRHTRVGRIFPNSPSRLGLIRAMTVEIDGNWIEAHRYLDMDLQREHREEALMRPAA